MIFRPPSVDWESFSICDIPSRPEPFSLINRIPIRENGEPLVDLRLTCPELSFAEYCLPYVRESVSKAMKIAFTRTPEHLDLRVFTALRTLEQQAEMYWGNYRKNKEQHPDWPESVVRKMTNRFFAPPDTKAPPGHCTGAAVDVGLISRDTGEGIDMRTPLDGWNGAPTAVRGLCAEAAENRRLLCYIMHSAGFSNCRDEFWHWSFGDSAWAVRVGAPAACYGLIDPPDNATRVTGPRLELAPYNPNWPLQFKELSRFLLSKAQGLVNRAEHVGSTAVPSMESKPVLDIDLVLPSEGKLEPLVQVLQELGYRHEGDLGVAGREAFRRESKSVPKTDPEREWPDHHLYACFEGSRELLRHLAFRDHLRSHPEDAGAYRDMKAALAAAHPWDRTRYTEAKTPFIEAILRRAAPEVL